MIYRVWNGKTYLSDRDYVIGNKGELLLSYAYLSNHHKDFDCDGDYTEVSNDERFKDYKVEWGFTYGGVDYFEGDVLHIVVDCGYHDENDERVKRQELVVIEHDGVNFSMKLARAISAMNYINELESLLKIKIVGHVRQTPKLLEKVEL